MTRSKVTHAGVRRSFQVALLALLLAACNTLAGADGQTGSTPKVVNGTEPPPAKVPHPFGKLSCVLEKSQGFRFCQGGITKHKDLRVPSFDGVPLDADVALPAKGSGPFPLIVLLHGLGGSKTDWEKDTPGAINDATLANLGYAVLMYTARGFGNSCGTATSRKGTPGCAKGWIHLADQRYEVRDTQYLAGLLVDEGLVKPNIAVAGVSYGAGQTLELAVLKNRIRLPNGKFAAWTSPKYHVPMSVAAGYAQWPWYDLVTSLEPNGRVLTDTYTPPSYDVWPNGVEKQSWDTELYIDSSGFYLAPQGKDPSADLTGWFKYISKGEPYSPEAATISDQLQTYHSAIGIPLPRGGPAPLVLQNGWTDTLFPVTEALHFAERLSADKVSPKLLMIFDDYGHGWAQGKSADVAFQTEKALAFINAVMLNQGSAPTGVFAIGQTCPKSAPSGPTISGPTFASLASGEETLSGGSAQKVTSGGGSPSVAAALNPAYFGGPLCNNLSAALEPGTATYSVRMPSSTTLIGGVVVRAHLQVKGDYPEMVGRLWDVDTTTNTRQLIEAGVYRPSLCQTASASASCSAGGNVTFELSPNMYTLPAGHILELELVGSNAPWFRASNGKFTLTVTNLSASIGTAG